MFTLIETIKTTTFFIGDIHGEFKAIKNWIKQNNLSDCNLIFCGDFGFGFESITEEEKKLLRVEKICEEKNVDCYILRGNHDDPSYYNTNQPKFKFKHINLLSDYTIIQTPNHNILCIGGAVSVDRVNRIAAYEYQIEQLMAKRHYKYETAKRNAKLYWWENEIFDYKKDVIDEIKKANMKIDVVATHNAPDFCKPLTNPKAIGWTRLDRELENDLYNERQLFTKLYEDLKYNGNTILYWFYGHYHMHNFETIEGTRFIGLDMGRQSKQGGGPGGNFDMSEIKEI